VEERFDVRGNRLPHLVMKAESHRKSRSFNSTSTDLSNTERISSDVKFSMISFETTISALTDCVIRETEQSGWHPEHWEMASVRMVMEAGAGVKE
jgi:hypothetical protein